MLPLMYQEVGGLEIHAVEQPWQGGMRTLGVGMNLHFIYDR